MNDIWSPVSHDGRNAAIDLLSSRLRTPLVAKLPMMPYWLFSSNLTPEEDSSFYDTLLYYVNFETIATPQIATAFALGSLSTIGAIALHMRYFKRIPTSDWVCYWPADSRAVNISKSRCIPN